MPTPVLHGYRHVDLLTHDPEATAAFHERAFGWRIHRVPLHGRTQVLYEAPGGITGAIVAIGAEETPGFMPYVLVRGLDAEVERLRGLGASILARPEVRGWGRGAVLDVPGGPRLAVWEPSTEG